MVKKLDEEMAEEAQRIHAGMIPWENRENDPVRARVRASSSWCDVRVWRYSPFGIDFINDPGLRLIRGEKLEVMVTLGKDEIQMNGLTVNELYRERDKVLVGVRTFRPPVTDNVIGDRRLTQRWTCADDYLPRGRAANPLLYNDFILFRLDNISAGGVRFITSMRNKLLAVGQRLDCTISLPLIGSVQTTLLIKNIDTKRIKDKEELVVGAQFIKPDPIFLECLAEYLLNFGDGISITSLKKDGYPVRKASEWFDFSYVKTEGEYQEVLMLRYAAYRAANKLAPDKKPVDMADEFDSRARILIVKYKGKIVGSLRAMFHGEADATDHGRYVQYPSTFPRVSEMVECSRICTDPDFRGSDVFYQLMAHLLLTTIKGGRRYVLGGAAGSLIPVYEKCGFRQVGLSYRNESLGGLEHQLILLDTHKVALGKDTTMSAWNQMYSSVVDYMIDQELIVPSSFDLFRINAWRALGRFGRRES